MLPAILALGFAVVVLAYLWGKLPTEGLTAQAVRLLFLALIVFGLYSVIGLGLNYAQVNAINNETTTTAYAAHYEASYSNNSGLLNTSTNTTVWLPISQTKSYAALNATGAQSIVTGYLAGYTIFVEVLFAFIVIVLAYNALLHMLKEGRMLRSRRQRERGRVER